MEAIPSKSEDIARYLDEGDYENYTILVHALKSSSRLIGAMQLSLDAARLEECGDKAREGDKAAMDEIVKKTPDLLLMYRSYYNKIMPLLSGDGGEDIRPQISEDELCEALSAIKEFVEAFDFDSADAVMAMLKDYRMPEYYEEQFTAVKKSLSAVDREELLKVL